MNSFADVAIYPGSFDPITFGHLNILERALGIFSQSPCWWRSSNKKRSFAGGDPAMISEAIATSPSQVDFHDGLTVAYARQHNIRTAVRGLRAVTDFEHEFAMALTNRSLWPEFDTVFLMTKAEYMYLSSSVVREVAQMGGQLNQFVPPCIERRLREKFQNA